MTTFRQMVDAPSTSISVSIFPANKGLKSALPSALIAHEELSQSRNIIHTTNGSRRTRPGIEEYYQSGFGSGEQIRCVYDFWRTIAGVKTQKVVAVTNGNIYADNADGAFSKLTFGNSFSSSLYHSIDALVGFLIIGLQGTTPKYWTMTGNAGELAGSPPSAWMVRKHRSSIYLSGDATSPDVLYKSNVEDPETWAGGTSDTFNVDLGASDPKGITSLSPTLFGRMYIGKYQSIYSLNSYNGLQSVEPVIDGLGMISHNATVSTQNDLIFPSVRGLHSMQTTQNYGDVATTFISFPIHDIWTSIPDFGRHQEFSGAFIPEYNSYLISFPKRGSSDWDLIGYNITTGDIFYWEGFNASFLTTFVDSANRTRLMVGTIDANIGLGRTMTDYDFSDFLEAFSSGFKTGSIFPTGQPKTVWNFKNLTVFFKPIGGKPINMSYWIDNKLMDTLEIPQTSGGGVLLKNFVLAENNLGEAANFVEITKEIQGYGSSIQLDFSSEPEVEDDSRGMEIYGYEVSCDQAGDSFKPMATG